MVAKVIKRLESPTWVLIERELRNEPLTVFEISKRVCVTPHNVRHYLREAHERGIIRIVGWTRRSALECGRAFPVYVYGRGADAPKPVGLTPAERKKRERANPLRRLERRWVKKPRVTMTRSA